MKKRIRALLACLLIATVCVCAITAAMPPTAGTQWTNTDYFDLAQSTVSAGAHCTMQIQIHSGSTIQNVSMSLVDISESPNRIIKTWTNPTLTAKTNNRYTFSDTVTGIIPGHTYVFGASAEVWNNGACDYPSASCSRTY